MDLRKPADNLPVITLLVILLISWIRKKIKAKGEGLETKDEE